MITTLNKLNKNIDNQGMVEDLLNHLNKTECDDENLSVQTIHSVGGIYGTLNYLKTLNFDDDKLMELISTYALYYKKYWRMPKMVENYLNNNSATTLSRVTATLYEERTSARYLMDVASNKNLGYEAAYLKWCSISVGYCIVSRSSVWDRIKDTILMAEQTSRARNADPDDADVTIDLLYSFIENNI